MARQSGSRDPGEIRMTVDVRTWATVCVALAALMTAPSPTAAQSPPPTVTAADYARAEKFLAAAVESAGRRRHRERHLAARRSLHLSQHHRRRRRVPARRSGERRRACAAFDHERLADGAGRGVAARRSTRRSCRSRRSSCRPTARRCRSTYDQKRYTCDVEGHGLHRGRRRRAIRTRWSRPTARAPCSSRTGTCGCATSPRRSSGRSRPTA